MFAVVTAAGLKVADVVYVGGGVALCEKVKPLLDLFTALFPSAGRNAIRRPS